MDLFRIALSDNLKAYRSMNNYSREKFAELIDVSPQYIYEIEIQRKFPSTKILNRIIEVMGISPQELFANNTVATTNNDLIKMTKLVNEIRNNINSELDRTVREFSKK